MALTVQLLKDQEAQPVAGQKKAEKRIYGTGDGELVLEGDLRARFLAYPVGSPIAPGDVEEYERLVAGEDSEPVEPGPMRVRLADAIVEAQRVLESNPSEDDAEAAAQQLEDATREHLEMRVRKGSDTGPLPEVPVEMYAPGAELLPATPAPEEEKVAEPADAQAAEQPAAKGTRRAANKAAAKPADKAASNPGDK